MGMPMNRSVWTESLYFSPTRDMNIGKGALSNAQDRRASSVRFSSSTKQAPTILLAPAPLPPSPRAFVDKLAGSRLLLFNNVRNIIHPLTRILSPKHPPRDDGGGKKTELTKRRRRT